MKNVNYTIKDLELNRLPQSYDSALYLVQISNRNPHDIIKKYKMIQNAYTNENKDNSSIHFILILIIIYFIINYKQKN